MTVHYFNEGLKNEYMITSIDICVYYFTKEFSIFGLKKGDNIQVAVDVFGEPDKIIEGYLPLYYYYDNDGSYIELEFKGEILRSVRIDLNEEVIS